MNALPPVLSRAVGREQAGGAVSVFLAANLGRRPAALRNLCVGSLIEAVRDCTKTVGLKQVNAVLMQPHWRHNTRDETQQPVVFTNQKPKN